MTNDGMGERKCVACEKEEGSIMDGEGGGTTRKYAIHAGVQHPGVKGVCVKKSVQLA